PSPRFPAPMAQSCHGRSHLWPVEPSIGRPSPPILRGYGPESSAADAIESPRLSRRLQTLRGWSHEQQIDEVRTRGAWTGRADGPGSPGRAQLPGGGDYVGGREDRLQGRDAADVGPSGRAGQWAAAGADDRRAGADQGLGARSARAAPGQRDPAQGVGVFCPGGARPPVQVLKDFIDRNRDAYGVEPICKVLPIAPSTYYDHASRQVDPARQPPRWHREQALASQIDRVWQGNRQAYGARKVWRQLHREGVKVARCTVERLMRRAGLQGVVRGMPRKWIGQELVEEKPMDLVKRQFTADRPNALWVSDFTYVPTWEGFVYVAFVIDVFARRIVG